MKNIDKSARQLVENCVIKNQTSLVEILLSSGMFADEIYPTDAILEWWLVDSWLAEQLLQHGEVVITDYGCHWWGRQSSGQAVWLDGVIREISAKFIIR